MTRQSTEDRNVALRRELVDLVNTSTSAARPRRRFSWKLPAVSVAAFALAGALTGAAVAVASSNDLPSWVNATVLVKGSVPNYVKLIGTPESVVSTGDSTLNVPAAPAGANRLIWGARCISTSGHIVARFDKDTTRLPLDCSEANSSADGDTSASTAAPHSVSVSADSTVQYVVWAGWVSYPPMPKPSGAQQAATADGIVTRQEYLDAYNRFAGCMTALGAPVGVIPETSVLLNYGFPGDNMLIGDRCYASEFQDVDTAWQGEHPQPSTGPDLRGVQPYDPATDPKYSGQ